MAGDGGGRAERQSSDSFEFYSMKIVRGDCAVQSTKLAWLLAKTTNTHESNRYSMRARTTCIPQTGFRTAGTSSRTSPPDP